MQVSTVAILLQDERARHTGAECVDLVVFKPDMPVRNEILVGQILQQLHLDQYFLEPLMIVAYRHSFAGELSKLHAVQDMLH